MLDFWIREAEDETVTWWLIVTVTGFGVGAVFGAFGAGGSAFATPVLALLGVPGAIAVASPLPAMLPASLAGARIGLRSGRVDRRLVRLSIAGGVPGTIVGALASRLVGGPMLLVLSGVMLLAVGARLVVPGRADAHIGCGRRRERTPLVVAAAFAVGFLTGLLANGGGFLLVPVFIVVFGLSAPVAAGTSMVAVGVLTLPTLAVHIALGHVDWTVASAFAVGMTPGSLLGGRVADRIPAEVLRRTFGAMLVAFALWFLVHQAMS